MPDTGHAKRWSKMSFYSQNFIRIGCLARKTVKLIIIVVHLPQICKI